MRETVVVIDDSTMFGDSVLKAVADGYEIMKIRISPNLHKDSVFHFGDGNQALMQFKNYYDPEQRRSILADPSKPCGTLLGKPVFRDLTLTGYRIVIESDVSLWNLTP